MTECRISLQGLVGKFMRDEIRGRDPATSTSAKPVMTKLQNLFVTLVNMDIFQMTLKFSLFTVD